jgi:uncharacterized protein involved in high-affinity Fe2+ transport
MSGHKSWIYPLIFVVVLAPIFVVLLLTYDPGGGSCNCTVQAVAHTHGTALASVVQDDMQLIFNVSPAAQLYQVIDGKLELCGGDVTDADLKHITVDVLDARLALGERLPVNVEITVRAHDSGQIVVQAGAPAMYAPGHGYHFGDNFRVPGGAAYDWEVVVSPVTALRQEGVQNLWTEPVTWSGSFEIGADGSVSGKAPALQRIGEFSSSGLHVMLSHEAARALYAVQDSGTTALEVAPGSRYFVVDVTDHVVNYEEKLPSAEVVVTFRQGDETLEVPFLPVISPVYGFHYGANVALTPGTWQITVEIAGLDFMRHAGPAAARLAQKPVSGTFEFIAS